MPEATQDIHDSAALGERVDALVGEVNGKGSPAHSAEAGAAAPDPLAEAAAVLSQLGDPSPTAPVEPGNPVAPEAVAAPEPAAKAAEVPVEAPAGATEDLAQAVEKLIQDSGPDAAGAAEAPAAEVPGAAPAAASDRIESLDAELAGIADDVIAGEFANESEVLTGEAQAVAPAAEPAPAPVEAAVPAAPVVAPVAVATPVVAPVAVAPKPALAGPRAAEPSAVLRLMWAISSPLRGKPQHVRDAAGWIALVQAFLALWVVSYVLFFRSNEPPLPTAAAPVAEKAGEAKSEEPEHAEKPAKKEKRVSKPTHPPKKGSKEAKEGKAE